LTTFSASFAYFVIFSDEFKFTHKTALCSHTKHLAMAPFPMMLLNLLLMRFKPSALLVATMACANGCSEKVQFRQYRLTALTLVPFSGKISETRVP
jgi:hypothetical protein